MVTIVLYLAQKNTYNHPSVKFVTVSLAHSKGKQIYNISVNSVTVELVLLFGVSILFQRFH